MTTLTMEPVTRIEGHAKITVDLDENGNVKDTKLHVMEFQVLKILTRKTNRRSSTYSTTYLWYL